MLRIDDFILYIPLKSDTNDYSLNGYTVTNNSVTSTTDEFGVSGNAYEWSGTTDNLEMDASMGNAYATASNSGTTTFYFRGNITNPGIEQVPRIFSQYGGAGNRAFAFSVSTLSGLNANCYVRRYSSDGTNVAGGETTVNSITFGSWLSIKNIINEDGATNNDNIYIDGTSDDADTGLNEIKANSTYKAQIGYQNNGGVTSNSFLGKIKNIIVMSKEMSSIEEKFIEKFGNMKRIA